MILGDEKMKKIQVEKERCIGCGACVNIASDTFYFDEEGKSEVLTNEHIEEEAVQLAIESCPTSAISIFESEKQNEMDEKIVPMTHEQKTEDEEDCCDCETCLCEHCDCSIDEEEDAA